MLLSMSTVNPKKVEKIVDEVAQEHPQKKPATVAAKMKDPPVDPLQQIKTKIQAAIKKNNLDDAVDVKYDANGVSIEFKDQLIFEQGYATIREDQMSKTAAVIKLITDSPDEYVVAIEGHTDDVPPGKNLRFTNNWELSAARGISLLEFFKKRGVAEDRLRVTAYADTQPKVDLDGLAGEELKAARNQNRRVVIRLVEE